MSPAVGVGGPDALHVISGMHAKQSLVIDFRRQLSVQHLEDFAFERTIEDADPVGAFRMAGTGVMFKAGRVANVKRRHAEGSLLSGVRRPRANVAPEPDILPPARSVHRIGCVRPGESGEAQICRPRRASLLDSTCSVAPIVTMTSSGGRMNRTGAWLVPRPPEMIRLRFCCTIWP